MQPAACMRHCSRPMPLRSPFPHRVEMAACHAIRALAASCRAAACASAGDACAGGHGIMKGEGHAQTPQHREQTWWPGVPACMPMRSGACPACGPVRRTLAPRLRCNSKTHNRHRSGVPAMLQHADGITWPLLSPVRRVLSKSFRPFAPSSARALTRCDSALNSHQRAPFSMLSLYYKAARKNRGCAAAVAHYDDKAAMHSFQSRQMCTQGYWKFTVRCIPCSGNSLWTNCCGNFEMPVTAAEHECVSFALSERRQ